jgi:hypothetical protein
MATIESGARSMTLVNVFSRARPAGAAGGALGAGDAGDDAALAGIRVG